MDIKEEIYKNAFNEAIHNASSMPVKEIDASLDLLEITLIQVRATIQAYKEIKRLKENDMLTKEESKYFDDVFNYAEYIGLNEYVQGYEAPDVARTYGKTIARNYQLGLSYRISAIILFALTLEKINRETKVLN